jgi:hypothetical protein
LSRVVANEDDLAKAQAKAVADTSNIMVNYMIKESGKVSSTVKESYNRLIRILEDPKIKEQAMKVLAGEITVVENMVFDDKGKPAGKEFQIVEVANQEQRKKLSAMVKTNVPRYIEESLMKMKIAQAQEMAKTIKTIEAESVAALKTGFKSIIKGDFFDRAEGATIMDDSMESVTAETMPAYVAMLKERLISHFSRQGYSEDQFQEALQRAEAKLDQDEKEIRDSMIKAVAEKEERVSEIFGILERKIGEDKIAELIGTDLGDAKVQNKTIQEAKKYVEYFKEAIKTREGLTKDTQKLNALQKDLDIAKRSILKETKEEQSDFVTQAVAKVQKLFLEILEKETPKDLKPVKSSDYLQKLKVKKTGKYTANIEKELSKMIEEINKIDPSDTSAIAKVFDKSKAKSKSRQAILDLPESVINDLASSISQGMDSEGLMNTIVSKLDTMPPPSETMSPENIAKLAEIREQALVTSMSELSEIEGGISEETRGKISEAILSGGDIDYAAIKDTVAKDFEIKSSEIQELQKEADVLNTKLENQLKLVFEQKKKIAGEKVKEQIHEINQQIKGTSDPEQKAALQARANEIKAKHEEEMKNMQYSEDARKALLQERHQEIEGLTEERESLEKLLEEIRQRNIAFNSAREAQEELRTSGAAAPGHAARVVGRYEGTESTPGMQQSHQNLQEASREVAGITGNTVTFGTAISQMMSSFGGYMLRLRLVQRGIEDIFSAIKSFQELEDISFELGIVSQMDVENIRAYRQELLQLATNYRQTAEEIGKAQIAVVKTGVNLKDAAAIVSNALILARATYADLQSATDAINKILLPMERSGEAAAKVADWVYNVTVSTPASLASVEQALRQTSSVFAGLLDDVVLSGQALDDYKDSVIETQLSLIGLGHVQGKTGSMIGTGLKMFVDRMRAPTDKQIKSLDMDFQKAGVLTPEGQVMTAIDLQKMVQTDFKQALNLISRLYTEGAIRQTTMADMVGTRHMSTITRLLTQIDGSIDSVNERYLNQQNLLENSGKSLESWSTELEKMKNNFRSLKIVALDSSDALKGLVSVVGTVAGKLGEYGGTPLGSAVAQTGMLGIGATKIAGQLAVASVTAQTISSMSPGGARAVATVTSSLSTMAEALGKVRTGNISQLLNAVTGTGTALGGLWSIMKAGFTAVWGLVKALGPWALVVTGLITIYQTWKKHIAEENKFRKESIDSINATIVAMTAYDQAVKQMNNALSTLSFSLGDSSNDIIYMSDTLRELQRELRVTQREMSSLSVSETMRRYRKSLEEAFSEDLSSDNKGKIDKANKEIELRMLMIERISRGAQVDQSTLERATKDLSSVKTSYSTKQITDKTHTSSTRAVAEAAGTSTKEGIQAYLDAQKYLSQARQENMELNSTVMQNSSTLFQKHTQAMKSVFGTESIEDILKKNEKSFSGYYIARRRSSEKEFEQLAKIHGQDMIFAMRQQGILTEYLDTKKFINNEYTKIEEDILKFSNEIGINAKEIKLENFGGEALDGFKQITSSFNDVFSYLSDTQKLFIEEQIKKPKYATAAIGGSAESGYRFYGEEALSSVEEHQEMTELFGTEDKAVDMMARYILEQKKTKKELSDIFKDDRDLILSFLSSTEEEYDKFLREMLSERLSDEKFQSVIQLKQALDFKKHLEILNTVEDMNLRIVEKINRSSYEIDGAIKQIQGSAKYFGETSKSAGDIKKYSKELSKLEIEITKVLEPYYRTIVNTMGSGTKVMMEEIQKERDSLTKRLSELQDSPSLKAAEMADIENTISNIEEEVAKEQEGILKIRQELTQEALLGSDKKRRKELFDRIATLMAKEAEMQETVNSSSGSLRERVLSSIEDINSELEGLEAEVENPTYRELSPSDLKDLENRIGLATVNENNKIDNLIKTKESALKSFFIEILGQDEYMKLAELTLDQQILEMHRLVDIGINEKELNQEEIEKIKQQLANPVSYAKYTKSGDFQKAKQAFDAVIKGEEEVRKVLNMSVDDLASMTYEEFEKRVAGAFPIDYVQQEIKNLETALDETEDGDKKKEIEDRLKFYRENLSAMGEENVMKLFSVTVEGRIKLAQEMGVTRGDIDKMSREIVEFGRQMERTRLDIDKIGLTDLSSEFYGIYQSFQNGVNLINTTTLDTLKESYEKSLKAAGGSMNIKGLSINQLDGMLQQEEDTVRRRVIMDRINFLKEEQRIDIEKNKIQKQSLHDLIMFQRNLRKEITSVRRDAGLLAPVQGGQAADARVNLQQQRISQISFMESLKRETQNISKADLDALITGSADIKNFDLTDTAKHYIQQLQILKFQMEDSIETLDRHTQSLNIHGRVQSETQKRQNEVTKAMNEYAKSMTPENFLAMQDAAEEALISMQTETLKATNELAGVFSQSAGMQHIITQTNLKIIEQELEVLEKTKHRYDSDLDYQRKLLTLQAKRVQADLTSRKTELEHKKNIRDLDRQSYESEKQRRELRGLGSGANPFIEFSKALKDSVETYKQDMEMMELEKEMEFKAIEFMKSNTLSVDKNTLAIEQNSRVLSMTKEESDIETVKTGLTNKLRASGISEDKISSVQKEISEGKSVSLEGLSGESVNDVLNAEVILDNIKKIYKENAEIQKAQIDNLDESYQSELEKIEAMKKIEWASKERLRREQLLTQLEQQRHDVIASTLGKHENSIKMLDAILKNDYSGYKADSSSLSGIIGGAMHVGMIPQQKEALLQSERSVNKEIQDLKMKEDKLERITGKDGINKDIYDAEKLKISEEILEKTKENAKIAKDISELSTVAITKAVQATIEVVQYLGNAWFANEQRVLETSLKRLEHEKEMLGIVSGMMKSREAQFLYEKMQQGYEEDIMLKQFELQDSQANQNMFNQTLNMGAQGAAMGAFAGPAGIALGGILGAGLGFFTAGKEKERMQEEQDRQKEIFETKKQVMAIMKLTEAFEKYSENTLDAIVALREYAETASRRGAGAAGLKERADKIVSRALGGVSADGANVGVSYSTSRKETEWVLREVDAHSQPEYYHNNDPTNPGNVPTTQTNIKEGSNILVEGLKAIWGFISGKPKEPNKSYVYVPETKTVVDEHNINALKLFDDDLGKIIGQDSGETLDEKIAFFEKLADVTEEDYENYLRGTLGITGDILGDTLAAGVSEIQEFADRTVKELKEAASAWKDAIKTMFFTGMDGFIVSTRRDDEKKLYEAYEDDMELARRLEDRGKQDEAAKIRTRAEEDLKEGEENIERIYGDAYVAFKSVFSETSFQKILEGSNLGKNFSDATVSAISETLATLNKNLKGKLFEDLYSRTDIADRMDKSTEGISNFLSDEFAKDKTDGGTRFKDIIQGATVDGVIDFAKLAEVAGVESPWAIFADQMEVANAFGKEDMFKTSEKFQSDMKENLDGISSAQARQAAVQAGLTDTWADALNYMSDTNDSLRLLRANVSREKLAWEESGNKTRLETLRIDKVSQGSAFTGDAELSQLEAEFTRLEFKEHVYSQFQAGIDKALDAKNYTERMSAFGSLFEETFKKTLRSRIGLGDEEMEIQAKRLEEALSNEDYEEVGKIMDGISKASSSAERVTEAFREELLDRGYLDTQIDAMYGISSKYKEISEHLRDGTVLSKELFNLEKKSLDYQTEKVTYKGQEIDQETLIKDLLIQQAEGRLDPDDLYIIENYEKTMAKIALHKQIITELPNQIFDISQNLSNIDGLMSTIATAYKENMLKQHHEFIASTGQELTDRISNNDWHGAYQALTKVNNQIHNQANFLQQERLKMLDEGMLSDDVDKILGTTSKYKQIASELDPRKILGRTFFEIEKKQIDLNKNQVEYNGKIIETERLVSNLLQAQAEGVELNKTDLNIITQYYNTVEKIERRKNLGNHIAQSIQNAFKASDYTQTFEAFAGGIGTILQDRITKSITKGMEPQLNQLLNTTDMAIDQMSIAGLYEAQQQMLMLSAKTDAMKQQYAGITDMFSNKFMEFSDSSKEINYQSASSKEVTYINNYTTQLNAGALIGDGVSMERLAKTLAPHIDKALKRLN